MASTTNKGGLVGGEEEVKEVKPVAKPKKEVVKTPKTEVEQPKSRPKPQPPMPPCIG